MEAGWSTAMNDENTREVIGGHGESLESLMHSRKSRQSQDLDSRVTPSLIFDFQADFKPNPE